MFPLWVLHQLLIHAKHARHFKKAVHPTRPGRALIGAPHRAFNEIVPRFLFEVDHGAMGRWRSGIPGRLGDYLDVLNLEAKAIPDPLRHDLMHTLPELGQRIPGRGLALGGAVLPDQVGDGQTHLLLLQGGNDLFGRIALLLEGVSSSGFPLKNEHPSRTTFNRSRQASQV